MATGLASNLLQHTWAELTSASLGEAQGRDPQFLHALLSWNLRGKTLEALSEAWDLLDLEDMDFWCLQEVGGLSVTQGPFDRSELRLGARDFFVFSCTPQ